MTDVLDRPGASGSRTGGPVLEINDLSISYFIRAGEVPAVTDFNLKLQPGESYGLVGESGCGKTTVAMAIMQYLGLNGRVVNGEILFEGQDLATAPAEELRRIRGARLSMVYQDPQTALNPSMTVGRQLMEVPIRHENVSREEAYDRVAAMLDEVRMPDPKSVMRRFPHQISGGQKQRVVIAMALLSNPSLLLLDEPTTGLDVTIEAAVVDLIAELREKHNTSLLYISHNLGLITKVCDRVGVMYSGELVEEGKIRDVFKKTRHPYTMGLFNCIPSISSVGRQTKLTPIPGQVPLPNQRPPGCTFGPRCHAFRAGTCDQNVIRIEGVADDPGHSVRCIRWREVDPIAKEPMPRANLESGATGVAVEDKSKVYGQRDFSMKAMLSGSTRNYVKANEDMDFEARRGQTLAIVGESGCGKSTFAKVLTGIEEATAGAIQLRGENIAVVPVRKRGRELIRSIQMVFQNPDSTLNPSHSVGWAISRALTKLAGPDESSGEGRRRKVLDLLDIVRLNHQFIGRKPRQLSGGQKQRVAIARAFAGNPEIVIADEPVSALDASVQAAVINLLREMQEQYNTTVLLISHDLGLVRYLADHVVVMYMGRVMEYGPVEDIFEPPYHPYTEALLSAVPVPDPDLQQTRIRLEGEIPSGFNPPPGCRFASRCPRKVGAICDTTLPPMVTASPGHTIACHIPLDELNKVEPIFNFGGAEGDGDTARH
ncbi:MAG: ABC transporter ATP-binding protein [Alphaproteobacteria bacterium]